MKSLLLPFVLICMTFHLYSQQELSVAPLKKSSLGFSVTGQAIGSQFQTNNAPTFRLDYRRMLKSSLELRLGAGYQHSEDGFEESGWSLAAGLNKYFLSDSKFSIYGAGELSFEKYMIPQSQDPNVVFSTRDLGLVKISTFAGAEYKPTSRLDIFVEPELFQFSIVEKSGSSINPALTYLRFLDGTRFGVKYRF